MPPCAVAAGRASTRKIGSASFRGSVRNWRELLGVKVRVRVRVRVKARDRDRVRVRAGVRARARVRANPNPQQ